jgi:tetratricopeptide (TPR) repeat protein
MRISRTALALAVVSVGCASPAPSPEQIASELPPTRDLDAQTAARVAERAEHAVRAAEAGRWGEAEDAADDALSLDPRSATARVARALCLMHEARREDPPELRAWRRADGELLLASRIAPNDPDVQLARARFLAADAHLSAAAECLEPSLARHPHHLASLREAARLRYELGEERLASALLVRLLAEAPDDAEALYRLAQCRTRIASSETIEKERSKALRDAARSFHRYVEKAPADADGWLGEAYATLAAARLDGPAALRAEADAILGLYRMVETLRELSPEPHFARALVLEETGERASARAAYRKALQLDPGHVPSLLNLAADLARTGTEEDAREAHELCTRALRLGLEPEERRRVLRFVQR